MNLPACNNQEATCSIFSLFVLSLPFSSHADFSVSTGRMEEQKFFSFNVKMRKYMQLEKFFQVRKIVIVVIRTQHITTTWDALLNPVSCLSCLTNLSPTSS